jgi:hypothetical protein
MRGLQAVLGDVFRFLPEASRVVAKEFGVEGVDDWDRLYADSARLEEFFDREEDWQMRAEAGHAVVVADGSLLQIRAYRALLSKARDIDDVLNRYHLILYCGIHSDFRHDGFRDGRYREPVDEWYRSRVFPRVGDQLLLLPAGGARLNVALDAVTRLVERRANR